MLFIQLAPDIGLIRIPRAFLFRHIRIALIWRSQMNVNQLVFPQFRVYRGKGLDTALTHFTELKENFYGKGAYNFSSTADLNAFGYEVMGNNEIDGAVKVFEMNAKMFPESANVWDSLAEAYMKAGNMEMAKEYYKKSLELDPRNQNAKDMLKKISGGN
jgi:pentatricopeptide repeat protein